jgi:hypothetical protein
MKALSIRQPWAYAILHLGKRIENRMWLCHYRGPVLIHASKWFQQPEVIADFEAIKDMADPGVYDAWRAGLPDQRLTPNMLKAQTGGIVGRARIIDCIRPGGRPPEGQENWYTGDFGIVLADVEPLPLVPFRGSLGLFDVPNDLFPEGT